jgi:hypothetical protein
LVALESILLRPLVLAGVVAMGERQVAALIPPRLPASVGRLVSGRGGRLPVAELLALPRAGSLCYGMARVDSEGRVSNRSTIAALGWCAGDRLHITVIAESLVVHRSATGVFAMPTKPYVVLPAAIRHRSGLGPGDQVLVAADPSLDALVVHPLAALDAMITAYHASLVDGGAGDDHPAP